MNWSPFTDEEAGIGSYTWAAGTKICGEDVVSFVDPHAHLSHKSHWTHSGHESHLHLKDGAHYMAVQALNDITFGGPLVTTVCHSNPLNVDTSPPVFNGVDNYIYDHDFNMLVIFYNITDPHSGISEVEFGLGKNRHDVSLRPYTAYKGPSDIDGSLVVKDVNIEPGKPSWIRLLAHNGGIADHMLSFSLSFPACILHIDIVHTLFMVLFIPCAHCV